MTRRDIIKSLTALLRFRTTTAGQIPETPIPSPPTVPSPPPPPITTVPDSSVACEPFSELSLWLREWMELPIPPSPNTFARSGKKIRTRTFSLRFVHPNT